MIKVLRLRKKYLKLPKVQFVKEHDAAHTSILIMLQDFQLKRLRFPDESGAQKQANVLI